MISVEPGDIVVVDFPGAEGTKRRPAVIISSRTYHETRPDIIVGVVTGQVGAATEPTDCLLQDWEAAGLHRLSAFRTYLATVLQSAVIRKIGRLSDRDWQAVRTAVTNGLAVLEDS